MELHDPPAPPKYFVSPSNGKLFIYEPLRRALYMATLSALQHNPVIRAFYQRLIKAGKPKKVAVCAVARKLLRIAWAVGTKGEHSIRPMQSGRK
jgi:hypothetical protein